MNSSVFHRSKCLLVAVGFLIGIAPFCNASDVSQVAGSYEVLQKLNVGSQTRVRVRLRLTNHRQRDLNIQRFAFQDFPHAVGGGSQACTMLIHAKSSVETTQEFSIPRADYDLWQRGTRPRLVLQTIMPSGRKIIEVIRLDPIMGKQGN